ncbi:S1C family serine protease [Streptomyces turgidiscabies]|uniref:Trypsin n=1 Tax=Streptomyces turgidiscabies (strain Car8) TaxID=698760 RepID=L7FAS2_STRT8|nr:MULTISPECIES: trypsin-like peptidase domain-containing protein [Streptomyces]ELP68136.1 trypsin [Streptomyces turgidiscabies Car8]MDX3492859.1 trypsin-like peptidase domain-containing protein [Streptomyces turgidiscabies]GAQ74229.1 periplasmic serine endoprotease DegP precursor [Streptomyces turgidiscabies]
MTESFRRSGEYETPQGNEPQSAYPQQHVASSPVNPEWPPPPAYEPPTVQQPAYQEPAQTPQAPHAPHAQTAATGTLLAESPAHQHKKRAKGPFALLAAVAIVAAAIGGGTAYGIQELTNSGTAVTSSSTSTNVVASSAKGTVSGVAAAVSPSIVEINATSNAGSSTGSGVIITSDGEIITNNHVIAGASAIKVSTSDGKTYTAKVVGTDSKKDLALIKLENASGLKTATLGDSAGVRVGDEVVAIGSPEGLTGTVTSGIVSALNRDVTVATEESQGQQQQQQGGGNGGGWPFEFGGQEFNGDTGTSTTTYKALQTDASLNPGNSGGALIDMNGNIIGINSAMYSATSSSSDAGSAGLGFAIPINTVKSDLATLRSGSTS